MTASRASSAELADGKLWPSAVLQLARPPDGPQPVQLDVERLPVGVGVRQEIGSYAGPFHASRTTHIFCLPTCRYDRRVLEKNRVVFESAADARAAGYRPCKVCRPAPSE